jgi:hypothetical protein
MLLSRIGEKSKTEGCTALFCASADLLRKGRRSFFESFISV